MEIQFTDRYKALGIPYPNPKTMCKGECEGTGWYPTQGRNRKGLIVTRISEIDLKLWDEAHNKGNIFQRMWHKFHCDGWHFVKCPDCKGTGIKQT